MKKIIALILFIMMIFPTMMVKADTASFYEAEYLPGAYIKKFKNGATTGKFEQMRMFRRTSDSVPAYCIELWENLDTNKQMQEIDGKDYNLLTEEVWQKVELIAYYGYGYSNHADLSWYIATQFLIWKEISKDSNIYFTDTLNGNKQDDKFSYEMNEINNLVNNHYKLPSFNNNNYNIGLSETIKIEDYNQVLNNYTISSLNLVKIEKKENILEITGTNVGSESIVLTKGSNQNQTKIYTSSTSQDLLIRGNYTPLKSVIGIEVTAGKIFLTKTDKDTKTPLPQGEGKLTGTVYNLYDSNKQLMEKLIINENSKAESKYLPYGTYYLEEESAGIGYQLDKTSYKIELTKDNQYKYLEVSNQVIKNKIKLKKLTEELNTSMTSPEKNAVFGFYNKENQKTGEIITDENGEGEIILPYGKYLVKQEKGKENHTLVEDFYIEVKEENQVLELNLINKEIGYPLKIIKVDADSNLPIRFSKTKFRIKDLKTNDYLEYQGISTYETDENGILELPFKLKIGKYQLDEIESPLGYEKLENPYFFEVNNSNQEKIELEIKNNKKYGSIEIIKNGENIEIQNNQFIYNKHSLENVEFSLYAEEDIITGDGKIHFYKDQLIKTKETNSEGKVVFDSLLYGKYYMIETKNLESYNADNQRYYVEINDLTQTNIIEKLNTLKKGTVRIRKLDNKTLNPISSTEFELYNDQMELIYKVKTDIEGNAYIFDLPLGKYHIKEVNVPFPYILSDKMKSLELVSNDQVIDILFKNDKQELEIEVPNTLIEESTKSFSLFEYIKAFIILLIFKYKK